MLLRALLSTSAMIALGTFVSGCENPGAQADKKVTEQVATAEAKTAKPEDRPALLTALENSAKAPGISNASKANIRLEQARIETDQADDMARTVGADEIEIGRLVAQVQALTAQVATNNKLIDGLRLREPKEALKNVDAAVASAKGSGDTATWGPADNGVPAASAVDAEIARINAEIQKLSAERTTLDAKQKQATDEARQLDEQASKAHGAEARDAGIKAAALKRDARNAAMRIAQIDRAVDGVKPAAPPDAIPVGGLKDQLKVQEARKESLARADKSFADRKAEIAADWEALKRQIDDYQAQSKTLLEGAGDAGSDASASSTSRPAATQPINFDANNPPTPEQIADALRDANISRLGKLIAKKQAQCDADRDEAIKRYDTAAGHVKDAMAAADQVTKAAAKEMTEKPAIDGLNDLFTANDFKIRLAAILLKKAQLHADQADNASILDDMRTRLVTALQDGGLAIPKELDNLPPVTDVAADRKTADDEYTEADTSLTDLAQSGSTPRAKSDQMLAQEMQIAEKYARAQYALRAGNKTNADAYLVAAKDELTQLNTQTPVPDSLYLTPELSALIVSRHPAPTTGPASAPSGPVAPGTAAAASPADFVVHNVGSTGATIKAPPTWQDGPAIPGALLVLAPSGQFGTNLNVVTQPLPAGSPGIEAMLPQLVEFIKPNIPKFQLVSSDTVTLGGVQAGRIIYDAALNDKPLRFEQYYTIAGAQFYVLTFTTSPDQFPALDPVFQQIAETLQLPAGTAAPATAPSDTTTPPATPATPPDSTTPPATPPTPAPAAPDAATPPATPATPAPAAPDAATPPAAPATTAPATPDAPK